MPKRKGKQEKDEKSFNDFQRWCHIIICGIEVEFEKYRKCNPKKRKG